MKKTLLTLLIAITTSISIKATTCAQAQIGVLGVNTLICSGTNDISGITGCGSTSYMGGEEALIAFTPATSGNLNIEYIGVSYSGIFVWDGCPSVGTCVGTPVTSSSTSKTMIVSVTAGTTYYIMVDTWPTPNSPCPGTVELSFPPPAYCDPSPSNVDGFGITNVSFGTPTTVNNPTSAETGNYGDYTAMIGDGAQGTNLNLDITYSTGYTYVTKVWVDWNNDLDFDDTGEEVYSGTSLATNPTTLAASFIIPLAQPLGNYRMRIGGADSGPPTPCYTGTYASYEDYTLNVIAAPSCMDPLALYASSITNSSAVLDWSAGGSEIAWNVVYGTAGFNPFAASSNAVNIDTLAVTGLSANTTYEFYVQAYCGPSASDTSGWAGPYSFTTLCNTIAVFPFIENFDDTSSSRSCWSNIQETGSADWSFGAGSSGGSITSAYNGTKNAVFVSQFGTNSPATKLVSPEFDLSSLTQPRINFSYAQEDWSGDQNFTRLLYRSSASGLWTEIWADSNNINTWTQVVVTLPNHSATYQIAFEGINNYGRANVIDEVIIEETPNCANPTSLSAFNLTDSSASLTWTAGGAENAWNVVYGTTGFNPFAASSNTASNDTSAITGLSGNTTYEFYVQAFCGPSAMDTSAWSGPFSFTTPCGAYLAPYYETYDTTILPTCWEQSATSGSGWVFSGNPGYAAAAAGDHTGNSGSFAWIDYSGTDVGTILESPAIDVSSLTTPYLEFYFYSHNTNNTDLNILFVESWTGTAWNQIDSLQVDNGGWTHYGYDISLHTYGSLTKVRFRGESGGGSGDFYNDLLIDDFAVIEGPTCFPPTALSAFNITNSSASLTWNPGGSETLWNVVYDTIGFNLYNGTSNAVTNDTLALTGLSANTSYEFYVQSDCGSGDTTVWVGPFSFTTPCNTIAVFPFTENFDDTSSTRSCWSNIQETGSADWTYGTGSSGGLITSAYNGTKNAVFVSQSGTNSPATKLVSPEFDLSSLIQPRIHFSYAQEDWFGDQNFTRLLYRTSSSGAWTEIWADSSNINTWTQVMVTLPNHSATYQIAFEGINNYGRANVIDEVIIEDSPADDLGAISGTSSETNSCELSDSATISMDIYNYGVSDQSGFNVQYSINGGSPVIETVADTISYNDTLTYTFMQTADLSLDGMYNIIVTTDLVGDADSTNNSFSFSVSNDTTPAAPSTIGDTLCVSGSATLIASNSSGAVINWYDASSGGNLISTGDTLVTPVISNTTSYWAGYQETSSGNVGPVDNNFGSGSYYSFYSDGLVFDALTAITINEVTAYPGDTTGNIEVNVSDNLGNILGNVVYNISGMVDSTGAVVIPLGISVPQGVGYSINSGPGTTLVTGLYRNNGGAVYPYNLSGLVSITGAFNALAGYYYFFYNWNVSSDVCPSALAEVIAFIDPCTNISENGITDFALYPNPNNGTFTVTNNGITDFIQIKVMDIQGKEVYKESSNFNTGSSTSIQLNDVESGMYLMSITSKNGRQLINIVVQ